MYRNKHPRHGIARVGDLFAPYTESAQSAGPRGGCRPVMRFWEAGYADWEDAKVALSRGPEGLPGPNAVPVDARTGQRLEAEGREPKRYPVSSHHAEVYRRHQRKPG